MWCSVATLSYLPVALCLNNWYMHGMGCVLMKGTKKNLRYFTSTCVPGTWYVFWPSKTGKNRFINSRRKTKQSVRPPRAPERANRDETSSNASSRISRVGVHSVFADKKRTVGETYRTSTKIYY